MSSSVRGSESFTWSALQIRKESAHGRSFLWTATSAKPATWKLRSLILSTKRNQSDLRRRRVTACVLRASAEQRARCLCETGKTRPVQMPIVRAIAKTADRSVVGVVNESARLANAYRTGDSTPDLLDLSLRLASTP